MTPAPRIFAGVASVALLAGGLSACGSLSEGGGSSSGGGGGSGAGCEGVEADSVDSSALKDVEISVGSKEFDEQLVLGQLTIKLLCAAGATVTDETNTKGSTQSRKKLQDDVVDVLWEYTGTGWINYLGHTKPITDSVKQYEAVRDEDLAKNQLLWGPMAPFNNTYAFATTKEFAEENSLASHSDMAAYIKENPDASVCVESEFATRPDGYPGFKKKYAISGGKLSNVGLGVVYTQIDKGNCTFGEIFTTDGRIAALDLTVLEDDKAYFPLYNGVAVTREDFDKENPKMLEVIKPLADTLTTEVMTELNKQISADGLPADQIAEDYLKKEGFIK